jgi:hypothetical protein
MTATLSPHITFPVPVCIHTHTEEVCCQQPMCLVLSIILLPDP